MDSTQLVEAWINWARSIAVFGGTRRVTVLADVMDFQGDWHLARIMFDTTPMNVYLNEKEKQSGALLKFLKVLGQRLDWPLEVLKRRYLDAESIEGKMFLKTYVISVCFLGWEERWDLNGLSWMRVWPPHTFVRPWRLNVCVNMAVEFRNVCKDNKWYVGTVTRVHPDKECVDVAHICTGEVFYGKSLYGRDLACVETHVLPILRHLPMTACYPGGGCSRTWSTMRTVWMCAVVRSQKMEK